MAFPQGAIRAKEVGIEAGYGITSTRLIKIIIKTKITWVEVTGTGTILARTKLMVTGLTRVGTGLVVAECTCLCDV